MNKKIIALLLAVLIILGSFIGYKALNNKGKTNPIDKITSAYKNYDFYDIKNYDGDIFKLENPVVNYSNTKNSLVIKTNNDTLSVYLIDDLLHIMTSNGVDYKYEVIGEVERIMSYNYCGCKECTRLVVLNSKGNIYYLDVDENIDYNNKNLFKKVESDNYYVNIGYIENLNVNDECGVNGLASVTNDNDLVIYDNYMHEFKQDYYDFISNSNSSIYIYQDGSLRLNENKLDIKASNIFVSNDFYYAISNDGYLYEINLNDDIIKKVNSNRVVKMGIHKKDNKIDKLIVVYSNASAKSYAIQNILVDMSSND